MIFLRGLEAYKQNLARGQHEGGFGMADDRELLASLGDQARNGKTRRQAGPISQIGLGGANGIKRRTYLGRDRPKYGSGAVLWAIATKVGTSLYTVGTTKADLRNWSGLPARFSVARLVAKAGQKLTVVGHPEATLVLPAGKVLLVSLKSTQENQPVVLRCTPLVP